MSKLPPSVRKFLNDNLKKARAAKKAKAKERASGKPVVLKAGDIKKMSKTELRALVNGAQFQKLTK